MNAPKLGYRLAAPGGEPGFIVQNEICNLYVFGMSRVGDATRWHLLLVRGDRRQKLTIESRTSRWSLTPPAHLVTASLHRLASGAAAAPALTDVAGF